MSINQDSSSTQKKLSGREQGQLNKTLFNNWVASLTDDDFRRLKNGTQLNRELVAEECGFSRSVLYQNRTIRAALERLDESKRQEGILDAVDSESIETKQSFDVNDNSSIRQSVTSVEHDQNLKKIQKLNDKVRTLEAKVLDLESQNNKLKTALSRYEEVSNVLSSRGILLR
ncbi:VPA1267 family protein [Vibrio sp. Makdt]|uniref:VPA1267 family protein n=1 Tax=Vibrio sp. Makdt TaxID=2998828 RepID=UPI0022CD5BE0|nr:VPA1267 family protein [Vibrio sp. Makdt]MDA0151584.1 VPA1267 family protein [Vibrio sp. Makdt]